MGARRRSSSGLGSCALSVGVLEFCRLLGSAGCISGAIRMRPNARELAAIDDEIFVADRPPFEEALEDFPCPGRVSALRRQRCPRNMRRHAVMGHGPPGMILGRRLREPYVAGVACELTAFERPDDCIAITNLGAGGVHEIS